MDLLEQSTANRHPWELARFVVMKHLLKKYVINFDGMNLLDLGCGDLYFLENVRKWQPEANYFAVDTAFSDDYINTRRGGLINVFKNLNDLPINDAFHIDVIFLMDVVEHIENDLCFLKELTEKEYVSDKTLFLITVPAYQMLFSRHDKFLKHFRRYSNASIEKVTDAVGLRTLEKGYFFMSLILPRYVELIREKLLEEKSLSFGTGLTTWKQNNLITESIKFFLLLDFWLHRSLKRVGIKTPGLSNYIICKKPA